MGKDTKKIQMISEMVSYVEQNHNVDLMNRRREEPIVVSRAALFNVCRGYVTASTLSRYFGMNHATILHHWRNHDALMVIDWYRELFHELQSIRRKFDEQARKDFMDVFEQLKRLQEQYDELKTKVEQNEKNVSQD